MIFAVFGMLFLSAYNYRYISYAIIFSALSLLLLFYNYIIIDDNFDLSKVLLIGTLAINYFTIFIYNYPTSGLQKVSEFFYGLFSILAILKTDNLIDMVIYAELSILMSLLVIFVSKRELDLSLELNKYFLIHGISGLFLLIGTANFSYLENIILMPYSIPTIFLLLGFGIKAGFPIFNTWMHSIYSNVSPNGTLPLSIFTTKIGIFGLYVFFPGYSLLIYIGLFVALVQLLFALLEDNIIKSYVHILNNQMGCMMIGIGIGTSYALNGVLALLITHIFYETFVFMIMGSLVSESKKYKFSDFKDKLVVNSPLMQIFVISIIFVSGMPYFAGFFGKYLFLHGIKYYSLSLYYLMKLIFLFVFIVTALKALYMVKFNSDNSSSNVIKMSLQNNVIFALTCQFLICLVIGMFGLPLPYESSYIVNGVYNITEQLFLIVFGIFVFYIIFHLDIYFYVIHVFNTLNKKILSYQKVAFNYLSDNVIEIKNKRFINFIGINCKFSGIFGNTLLWFLVLVICALILYLS